MNEDAELLRRYAVEKSEAAFAEFVQRRVDFVYACAVRRVGGDAHFADDVTQQVFIAAARNAGQLAQHPVVTGWLFTTTRNVAGQLVRGERRRHAREQEAEAMDEIEKDTSNVDWERLRPVLDAALDALDETDRQAVLLRFFEGKSFSDVGGRLRLAENTARMRVNRALEKLCSALQNRGVTSTSAALTVALASQPGLAAPAGLAAAATGAALASAGAGTGAVAVFMGMTKLQIGIAGALVAAGVTGFAIQARELSQLNRDLIQAEQLVREDGAKLGADNVALKAALKESTDADSARSTEVAALKDEANTLRNQLNAASSSQKQAASGVRGTQVFDIATVDVQPQARLRTSPKYPLALRRLGITGEATIDFVVDAQGVVQNARALKSTHSELAEAAVAAVQRWRFAPAQKGGRSVATHLQVPIIFTINDDTGAPQPVPIPWF